jgi:hypothetical protein
MYVATRGKRHQVESMTTYNDFSGKAIAEGALSPKEPTGYDESGE